MGESKHSIKLFGVDISSDDNGDSVVSGSRNKRSEDEDKGISEVEKTGDASSSRTEELGCSSNSIELFDVKINYGDSIVLRSRNKRRICSEDAQKCTSEVEEIEKTRDVSSSRTKEIGCSSNNNELFDVEMYTEIHDDNGDSVVLGSTKKEGDWTNDEHKAFLIGLERLGKPNWTGIAKEFVPSRTNIQVYNHAQKYFARLEANNNKAASRLVM
ncbi:transcription factor MYB1R1-like [Solanum dulcamara]|nr:transcription factor MYB1R1-like [Solanum dulcamara]